MSCKARNKTRVYNLIKKWDKTFVTYKYLSESLGINEREVAKICDELENEKLISREVM